MFDTSPLYIVSFRPVRAVYQNPVSFLSPLTLSSRSGHPKDAGMSSFSLAHKGPCYWRLTVSPASPRVQGLMGEARLWAYGRRARRNQPSSQPAWGLSYFCLQVSEGWSPHFPGLLVVHKCCPPRSGRGLSSYLEHMQGGGTLEVGVLGEPRSGHPSSAFPPCLWSEQPGVRGGDVCVSPACG